MSASTAAVLVPVKSLARAKSRLADLGDGTRRALVLAMLEDVLTSVRLAHRGPLHVLSSDSAYEPLARRFEAVRIADGGRGYNGAVRTALGLPRVLEAGAALVVPADVPGLRPSDVEALLAALDGARGGEVVLAASDDGGTSALGLRPPSAIEVAFGRNSATTHRRLARRAGRVLVELTLPTLAIDVDTLDDLEAVRGIAGAATSRVLAALGVGALAERRPQSLEGTRGVG